MCNFTTVHRGDRSPGALDSFLSASPAAVWLSVIQSLFEGLSTLSTRCRDALSVRRECPVNRW